MIEFPVSKKQGITRQSIAMIAFSQDIQRRMRTDTENSIYAHVGFDSTAKLAFCDFVSSGTQTVSGTNPTGGIDPLPQFQPNTGVKNAASTGVITPGCNPDFNVWTVGVRTVWNPVKNLDIGLEVFHDQIEQKWDPNLWHVNFSGSGGQPSGQYRPADLGVWAACSASSATSTRDRLIRVGVLNPGGAPAGV